MIRIQPNENRVRLPDIRFDPPEALALSQGMSKLVVDNNFI